MLIDLLIIFIINIIKQNILHVQSYMHVQSYIEMWVWEVWLSPRNENWSNSLSGNSYHFSVWLLEKKSLCSPKFLMTFFYSCPKSFFSHVQKFSWCSFFSHVQKLKMPTIFLWPFLFISQKMPKFFSKFNIDTPSSPIYPYFNSSYY